MEQPTKTPPKTSKVFSGEVGAGFFGSIKLFITSKRGMATLGAVTIIVLIGACGYVLTQRNSATATIDQVKYAKPERDRIADEKQQLAAYSQELEKNGAPKDDAEEQFVYYNTLINNALAQQDCKKATSLASEYGLQQQNLQKFSNATLESLGTCYMLVSNRAAAKLVFTVNLNILVAAKTSSALDPAELPALNHNILYAQKLVEGAK